MEPRYSGWEILLARLQFETARHGISAYAKPKNGYLAVELPASAPEELQKLADEIEFLSDVTCQYCSASRAREVIAPKRGWILKLCDSCYRILEQKSSK